MALGLLIGGAVVALIGLFLWMAKNRKEGKSAILSVTETSKVSEINENFESMRSSMGNGNFTHFCEVKGVAWTDTPLTSELAKEKCVYYSSKIVHEYERLEENRDSNGKVTKRWAKKSDTVSENIKWANGFGLKDDTGFILIDPAKAEIHPNQVHNNFERGEPNANAATLIASAITQGLMGSSNTRRTIGYRYTESAILLNANLYVVGDANDREGRLQIAKPADKKYPFIVSTKSETELTGDLGSSIKGLNIGAWICWIAGACLAAFGLVKLMM